MKPQRWARPFRWVAAAIPFAIFVLLWELVARSGIYNEKVLPAPSTVAAAFREMLLNGELARDVRLSGGRALAGFAAGALLGFITGIVTGRSRAWRFLLHPLLHSLRSIPSIALLPLAILFLGLDESAKIFLVFWGVFFPMWVNAHLGVASVDYRYVWAATSLGAGKWRLLLEVIVPAAFPLIVAGMRVAIGLAFLNLVAAEMSGASAGLGYRVSASHLVLRTDKMIAALVSLGVLGAASDKALRFVAGKVAPWYDHVDAGR